MQLANHHHQAPPVVARIRPHTRAETLFGACALLGFTHFVIHMLPWPAIAAGASVVGTILAIEVCPQWPTLLLAALLVILIGQMEAILQRLSSPPLPQPPAGPQNLQMPSRQQLLASIVRPRARPPPARVQPLE